jgi:propanol-preferring alcohol dehydrogenase
MEATVGGLSPYGELLYIGAGEQPLKIGPADILFDSRVVRGHNSETARDIELTFKFAERSGVRPIIETITLDPTPYAYQRMLDGQARFRMAIDLFKSPSTP